MTGRPRATPRPIRGRWSAGLSKLDTLVPLLDPEVLVRVASPKAMKAGQELFNNKSVSDIVVDREGVRGKVKGEQGHLHATRLERVVNQSGQARLDCNCTCPTFSDGWEKICHHGVALGLELRKQFLAGGDLTMTQKPLGHRGRRAEPQSLPDRAAARWLARHDLRHRQLGRGQALAPGHGRRRQADPALHRSRGRRE